jgi:hypothetical protein
MTKSFFIEVPPFEFLNTVDVSNAQRLLVYHLCFDEANGFVEARVPADSSEWMRLSEGTIGLESLCARMSFGA